VRHSRASVTLVTANDSAGLRNAKKSSKRSTFNANRNSNFLNEKQTKPKKKSNKNAIAHNLNFFFAKSSKNTSRR
jgi:hypothetical protein